MRRRPLSRLVCPIQCPPSLWRRLLRALWLCAAVVLMLAGALALALQWVVLPHISSFRQPLERMASHQLGLPVHIAELVLTRPGWQPQIEMRGVELKNHNGRDVLRIETVQAVVSLPASLRAGFERLTVIAPQVQAHRFADGHIEVAGVRLEQGKGGDSGPALRWLLSQPELTIEQGSLRWSDDMRTAPPLALTHIHASLKNAGTNHVLNISATPPQGWGRPILIISDWRHPLLHDRTQWKAWSGMAYADMPELDVSQLRRYVDLGRNIDLRQGHGSLRLWADFDAFKPKNLTAEVQLDAASVRLHPDLQPLALEKISTLLALQYSEPQPQLSHWSLRTSTLQFVTADGQPWPGGNVYVALQHNAADGTRSGSVQGNQWNMGLIGRMASRLPLGQAALHALDVYQPAGTIEQMAFAWTGSIDQPTTYRLQGHATGIRWRAQTGPYNATQQQFEPGVPGVEGATVTFDARHDGGHMDIALRGGVVEFPGVFEEPRLLFDELTAPVQWRVNGQRIHVDIANMHFANADARGHASATWHTRDVAKGEDASQRFPGVLDLSATIDSAKAERVYRYLPQALGQVALHYVRDAVRGGDIHNARVRVQGNLAQIPFDTSTDTSGDNRPIFRFEVPLRNAVYRFVPASLQAKGELPWPALTALNGLLVIDKNSLSITDAQARFSTAPDVRVQALCAHIPDMTRHFTVGVTAKAQGPLAQMLHLANTSPLTDFASHALEQASATGMADVQFTLGLPIEHMQRATVKGQVHLRNNDVRITPDTPLLARTSGQVQFSEQGFALQDIRTHLLGGSAQVSGGTLPARKGHPRAGQSVAFHAKGMFSSTGLQQEGASLGGIARLAAYMKGQSPYTATLRWRHGAPEFLLETTLQGMELNLPAPLTKPAATALPLHFENTIVSSVRGAPTTDRLLARLGKILSVEYIRDVQARHRVLRGSIAIGEDAMSAMPPMPDNDVHALVRLPHVDGDAWRNVLLHIDSQSMRLPNLAPPAGTRGSTQDTLNYLPTIVAAVTPRLQLAQRQFDDLVLAGTRSGRLWNVAVNAQQIAGNVRYLQPQDAHSAGALQARLSHLHLEPASVHNVVQVVEHTDNPLSLPALDIEADAVSLLGYRLNHIIVQASNSLNPHSAGTPLSDEGENTLSHAWRIHRLEASAPHARLSGAGAWVQPPPQRPQRQPVASAAAAASTAPATAQTAPAVAAPTPPEARKRRVYLTVRLESDDLGAALEHFGVNDIASGGAGVLSGSLRWNDSPVEPDIRSLSGNLRLDMRHGSILRIDPGAARLLSLLSIKSLGQRGSLSGKGFAYQRASANVRIRNALAHTDDLHVLSSLANVRATGDVDIKDQHLQLDVLAQPQIDLGTPALLLTAVNPLLGASSYLAQFVLSHAINRAAVQVMTVQGPWDNLHITKHQGDTAKAQAQRILQQQRQRSAHQATDPLWDWWPVTGHRNASASPPALAHP